MSQLPLLVKALRRLEVDRPPVWLMRQAGRYLSEYRAVKEQHGFLGMCRSAEIAAEVTLQPVRIFDVDAAIIFSDILLPAACLGIEVDFNPGPVVKNPIRSPGDLNSIKVGDPAAKLSYVLDALRIVRSDLEKEVTENRKAVIGFAGAPWTLACYLIDQGPYKHFAGTQIFAQRHSEAFKGFVMLLADLIADYLLAQIEAGADVVQIFDSWGGNLSEEDYRRFALPANQRIIETVRHRAPVVLYVGGGSHLLSSMYDSGADCLSVDWRTSLEKAVSIGDGSRAVQGNLDPAQLFAPVEEVIRHSRKMLGSVMKTKARHRGYVANLGHGVLQETPRESVKAFVDTVKQSRWSDIPA